METLSSKTLSSKPARISGSFKMPFTRRSNPFSVLMSPDRSIIICWTALGFAGGANAKNIGKSRKNYARASGKIWQEKRKQTRDSCSYF